MKRVRLSKDQQAKLIAERNAGASATELSKKYNVSVPTVYNISKTVKPGARSAVSALQDEIAAAENRIVELQKFQSEISVLQEQIRVKKTALESLLKLEPPLASPAPGGKR